MGRVGLGLVLLLLSAVALALVVAPRVGLVEISPPEASAPRLPPSSSTTPLLLTGVVEPSSELISVAAPVGGVVSEVRVRPGDTVARGDVLFSQDARQAEAQLEKAEAVQEVARVDLEDQTARLKLYTGLTDHRAVSTDEIERVRFAADRARANLAVAVADVARAKIDLDRLTVRSPIDGMVLKVNVRPGEFAAGGDAATAPVIMGQVKPLHVRVVVDADDVARLRGGGGATGSLVGGPARSAPLNFVRFEPEARADASSSRRMIEAVYAFDPEGLPAFVGQQIRVAIPPMVPRAVTGGGVAQPPGPVASPSR